LPAQEGARSASVKAARRRRRQRHRLAGALRHLAEAFEKDARVSASDRLAANALARFDPANALPADQVKSILKGESYVRMWREAQGLALLT